MKQILVPTDFSDCANKAVDFAVNAAKLLPLEITLLHGFDLQGDLYTDYMGVSKEYNQIQLNEVYSQLALLKKTISEKEGVEVKTLVVKSSLHKAVEQVVENTHIDLVVMGTLGASGIKEILFGSKTAKVISHSKVPVFAIPGAYKWKRPENVLFATNHFEKEHDILDFLFDMADLFKAQVHTAVFTNEYHDDAITFLEHSRNIPQYQNMLREQYQEETINVIHLFGKNFEETLQDCIRQNKIDVLVMVTYQRGLWNRIFNPSMTKRMSYHTDIPLLAIPAAQAM